MTGSTREARSAGAFLSPVGTPGRPKNPSEHERPNGTQFSRRKDTRSSVSTIDRERGAMTTTNKVPDGGYALLPSRHCPSPGGVPHQQRARGPVLSGDREVPSLSSSSSRRSVDGDSLAMKLRSARKQTRSHRYRVASTYAKPARRSHVGGPVHVAHDQIDAARSATRGNQEQDPTDANARAWPVEMEPDRYTNADRENRNEYDQEA
jgi:hypothetical protein